MLSFVEHPGRVYLLRNPLSAAIISNGLRSIHSHTRICISDTIGLICQNGWSETRVKLCQVSQFSLPARLRQPGPPCCFELLEICGLPWRPRCQSGGYGNRTLDCSSESGIEMHHKVHCGLDGWEDLVSVAFDGVIGSPLGRS